MTSSNVITAPTDLFESLLRQAGIGSSIERWSILGISTNRVWEITAGGRQYVVRQLLDDEESLVHKELYVSKLLRQHSVPAPEVLAVVTDGKGAATLNSFLPGIRLDQAIHQLSVNDLESAWRSAGAVLRIAHEIVLPDAGEIIGNHIEPFEGGWSHWVTEDLVANVLWLQQRLNTEQVAISTLERIVIATQEVLRHAPTRLLHNDALPQNIMVAPTEDAWMCTGWIDWEFARAGDPLWDVSTLDFRSAGLVPKSFYEGYGFEPSEPQTSIYELLMALWRTRIELEHGASWDWPPHQARIAYLQQLPTHIKRLAELLGIMN